MEDETIKVQFEKLDAPPGLTRNVLEMTKKNAEGKTEKIAEESILTSEYSYDQVEQALLVLYQMCIRDSRGGDPYLSYHKDDTVSWDGFRFISSLHTGDDGKICQTVNHGYHYEKTFCDGHPEPALAEIPEEETDENGEVSNQDEIDEAEEENERLQEDWQACIEACEDYADQYPGVHFHWINDGADASASGEVAFAQSGCQACLLYTSRCV